MKQGIWRCPNPACEGVHLREVTRMKRDEKGIKRFAGIFYGCPNWKTNGCDYTVSLETGKASGEVYRTYVLGANNEENQEAQVQGQEEARSHASG